MSRYIYQNHFKDLSGNAVGAGTITIFTANTTTLATVYSTSGSSAINGSAVTSDSTDGFFKFWVSTTSHAATQRFKLKLSKAGYTTKEYDDVAVYAGEVNLSTSQTFASPITFSGTVTCSSKLGFFGNTAQAQHSSTGSTAGFAKGTTTLVPVNPDATFTGNVGGNAYTIDDIVKALKTYGLMSC